MREPDALIMPQSLWESGSVLHVSLRVSQYCHRGDKKQQHPEL